MLTKRTLTEPSPAGTPLEPPPTSAAPSPTPDESAPLPPDPFADELPPDFWGDEAAGAEPYSAETQHAPASYTDDDLPPNARQEQTDSPAQAANVTPLTGPLEDDPRFVFMTELFPGHMTDWQSAETPTPAADDAAEAPETVDLEAGLDADETD